MTEANTRFEEWAVLELMGHRRLAGLVTEAEIAGGKFLRLDIPGETEAESVTQFYAPASVYCITPTTERIARSVAAKTRPEPVHRWELPALPEGRPESSPTDWPEDDTEDVADEELLPDVVDDELPF